MSTNAWSSLALVGLAQFFISSCLAAGFQEDFSAPPQEQGWHVFGDTNLFSWDSTNQDIAVTWDSSQPNSYFYHSLGTILTDDQDFSFAFDLSLQDFTAGVNPEKPNPFQLAVGLLNLTDASRTNFVRGTGSDSPNLVEFSFFPDPGGAWKWGPSITAEMADALGTDYFRDWSTGGFLGESLTANDLFRVTLHYTATNHALHASLARNGLPFLTLPDATLGTNFLGFGVDSIAICSYSDAAQDPLYAGSILAHGTVDNFVVTLPPPPLGDLSWAGTGKQAQVEFLTQTNWSYALERTENFKSWTPTSASIAGDGTIRFLQDTNAPVPHAFYRVRADRL